jgi:hypothetical protein
MTTSMCSDTCAGVSRDAFVRGISAKLDLLNVAGNHSPFCRQTSGVKMRMPVQIFLVNRTTDDSNGNGKLL